MQGLHAEGGIQQRAVHAQVRELEWPVRVVTDSLHGIMHSGMMIALLCHAKVLALVLLLIRAMLLWFILLVNAGWPWLALRASC